MITIVTSRTFLICESVSHITLAADPDWSSRDSLRQRFQPHKIDWYVINIDFIPIPRNNSSTSNGFGSSSNSSSRNSETTNVVSVKVVGEKVALALFKELVSQIREQMPDQAYLDSMVTNILTGKIGDLRDEQIKPIAKKTSRVRSKKRRSKKVLRRSK